MSNNNLSSLLMLYFNYIIGLNPIMYLLYYIGAKETVLVDIIKEAGVRSNKTLKIKIEVERKPLLNFSTAKSFAPSIFI